MGKKSKEDIYSTANFLALYLNSGYGSISDSTNIEHDYDCLLKWMMSLQANVTHIELNELTSGRAFIDALRVIDSNYFNDAWMEVFKDANYEQREWRLRANVLRKILKSVLKYNEEICNNVISKNILPNVMVIARDGSKEEIIKFIRIVVAAAVNGPGRDGMIKNIFDLENSVQHTLMLTIQGVLVYHIVISLSGFLFLFYFMAKLEFEGDNSGELEVECKSAVNNSASLADLSLRCEQMEKQVKHLTAERDNYVQEIDKLKHQLSLVCKRNEDSENEKQREISELKIQIETLRDSLNESESARDQMATEYDELLRQVQHSQMMKENSDNAEKMRKLVDEVDELRARVAEADALGDYVATLEKKLGSVQFLLDLYIEVVGDLKAQVKALEELESNNLKLSVDFEEEQRKSHTYKLEAGVYKRQAQSLEQRLEEAVEKSLQLEKEKQLIADRLAVLDQEHDRTLWERNQLSSRVEELRKRLQADENKMDVDFLAGGKSSPRAEIDVDFESKIALAGDAPMEIKHMLFKLKHENRILTETLTKEREQQKKCFDQASEEKCRLQSIIGDLEGKLSSLLIACAVNDRDNSGKSNCENVDPQQDVEEVCRLKGKISRLYECVADKEREIVNLKTAHTETLEKARQVICHLDVAVKMNADDSNYTVADVEAMKARLVQNEATIEDLKEENNRQQIMFEQEERLITTAFYELAWQMHRKASEDRLAACLSDPVTFLAEQRKIVCTKPSTSSLLSTASNYAFSSFASQNFTPYCLLKNEKMNILPKKRWHVRTKDNVAKVRRDIAQAEVEERQRLARVQLAEQEARTRFLISKVEHLIPKQRNNIVTVDQSDASGHVNLFADLEFQESTNFGLNREAEQEKRLLKEKEERRIGLLKYLGEGSSEYTKKLAWWQQVPDRHRTKPADNNDVHSSLDVVDVKHGQVNNNHKKKKKMMLSIDELRRKRLNREREERLKAEKLKRKHENNLHERDGGGVDNQQAKSAADDSVKPKYSNQFNPIIAKQNRK
ncbi:Protein Hook -like protein 3 [Trichinella spiralis]|uniref:Protein Hook-like protein 3 n=1 Tax=Trichinella spiralis TaxID=6334 RepID=A0A0V1BP77_TRISP|nr:Protein Hook -like protein 3 [Trichinella spiralis]